MVSAKCVSLRSQTLNMRKSNIILIAAFVCLILVGCTNQPKTTAEKIDTLKQQVLTDANDLQDIDSKVFTTLQKDFLYCDSLLQYLTPEQVDARFEQLNLTQAYLLQYREVKPVMEKKMDYLLEQLDNLKADAESHYLSDSLVTVYLATETRVADTLHAQVAYFQTSFDNCQKELNKLKKSK